MQSLLFDARRYDLSAVGRYKFNKKLDIANRLTNQILAAPLVDPWTGEILADAGETITRERARELADRGVNEALLDVEGTLVKVFANNMVDMSKYVNFDPEECGVTERVRISVLKELLEEYADDEEDMKAAIRTRLDDLMPKHIIVDDMLASVNYLTGLACGVGHKDDIDHLGNRRLRCVGELLQNQFRIGFSRMERVIRERMTIQDLDIVTPQSLINIRQGIFRFLPSEPVHGSDQSPGGTDPQAPYLCIGPRRSVQRACLLRRARRPLQSLRPSVSH